MLVFRVNKLNEYTEMIEKSGYLATGDLRDVDTRSSSRHYIIMFLLYLKVFEEGNIN